VVVRSIKRVDQMFVLTMRAYDLVRRLERMGQIRAGAPPGFAMRVMGAKWLKSRTKGSHWPPQFQDMTALMLLRGGRARGQGIGGNTLATAHLAKMSDLYSILTSYDVASYSLPRSLDDEQCVRISSVGLTLERYQQNA
jgi:hypothetical protein